MCLEASLILCRGRVSLKFTNDESRQLHTKRASKPQCVLTKDIESFTAAMCFLKMKHIVNTRVTLSCNNDRRNDVGVRFSQAMRRIIDHTCTFCQ